MVELFPGGFEERELDGGDLELAAYVESSEDERLWEALGPGRVDDVEPGWIDAWKHFHGAVRIGPLWIGPPWADRDPDALAVVIDPGRAFGTGGHATTHLCIELLVRCPTTSFVDLGCGSGVVAIAAAKLGFSPVFAFDLDETAVAAARANAAGNEVDVVVERRDVLRDPLPAAELAAANIALEPVEALAARRTSKLLITSGYLAAARPRAEGWEYLERRERDGWAADLLARLR